MAVHHSDDDRVTACGRAVATLVLDVYTDEPEAVDCWACRDALGEAVASPSVCHGPDCACWVAGYQAGRAAQAPAL